VILGLAVSFAFTWVALRQVDLRAVSEALGSTEYVWLLPAALALAAAVVVRAERWRLLFVPGRRPPRRETLDAVLLGILFNTILPVRAGEAARVVALHQRAGVPLAEVGASAVTERLYDLVALLLLLFACVPLLPEVTWLRAAVFLALALLIGLAVAVGVLARYGDRPVRAVLRPLVRLPRVTREAVDGVAASAVSGLAGLRVPRVAAPGLGATLVSWVLLVLSAWLLMEGADLGLGLDAAVLVVVATNLALVVPSSPAAVGVYEAAVLVALAAYGIDGSQALSYALVLHALNFLPFLVVGWVVLHRHARLVRRSGRERSLASVTEAAP
jgi:uncharacterized protein (TIRG00374 family)